ADARPRSRRSHAAGNGERPVPGRGEGVPELARQPRRAARDRGDGGLHRARDPLRELHPPADDSLGPAVGGVRRAGDADRLPHGPEHLRVRRHDHADRHRREERDHADRLRARSGARGQEGGRSDLRGLPDPLPADHDDDDGGAAGRGADCGGLRRRRRSAAAARAGRGPWTALLTAGHALSHAGRLHIYGPAARGNEGAPGVPRAGPRTGEVTPGRAGRAGQAGRIKPACLVGGYSDPPDLPDPPDPPHLAHLARVLHHVGRMRSRALQLAACVAALVIFGAAAPPQRSSHPTRAASRKKPAAKKPAEPPLKCGDYLSFQVLLDRQGFSTGQIDGRPGTNLSHALGAAQSAHKIAATGQPDCDTWKALGGDHAEPPLVAYTITDEDMQGPFEADIPHELAKQASLPALGYRTPTEMLAERFHASPALLQKLNEKITIAAGQAIQVPAVTP